MKIYIYYKVTDDPWGGGNSFLKYFQKFLLESKVEIADDINDDYDVLFANSAHKAPGVYIDLNELKNIKRKGHTNYKRFFPRKNKKLIFYRSDGFRQDYAEEESVSDKIQAECLCLSDYVIFQNNLCLDAAKKFGFNGDNYTIIHNGADQDIFSLKKYFWDKNRKLKVLSVIWSSNLNKGYKDIAEFSTLPEVESVFYGNWPKQVDPKNVKVHSPLEHGQLAKVYQSFDVLLHPAKFDPSPNVCTEAISCGLPIIYHKTSGIKELAADCGIEFDENNIRNIYDEITTQYDQLVSTILARREYFSKERVGKEYLAYIKQKIDETRSGATIHR